jgi:hypothetical protein
LKVVATQSGETERGAVSCIAWLVNILGESLEALSILLFNGDRDMARLARVDIVNCSGFADVRAADDATKLTVLQFAFKWHDEYSFIAYVQRNRTLHAGR